MRADRRPGNHADQSARVSGVPEALCCFDFFPILTAFFDIVGIFGGHFPGVSMLGVDEGAYWNRIYESVSLRNVRTVYQITNLRPDTTAIAPFKVTSLTPRQRSRSQRRFPNDDPSCGSV